MVKQSCCYCRVQEGYTGKSRHRLLVSAHVGKAGHAEPRRKIFRIKQSEQEEKSQKTPPRQWRKPRETVKAQTQGI